MLDGLTLDQLRVLVAVAETGSFRAAAKRIRRVQSAVSHAIATLEAQLGVVLFDRSARRPEMTPQGRALLTDAKAILLRADAMRARARGMGEGVELGVSLVVDTLFPLKAVAHALRGLQSTYPSVAVNLRTAPLGEPLVALRDGRCTLAITVGEEFREPQIQLEALSPVPFVVVAAAHHPLAMHPDRSEPLDPAELMEHLQIVLEDTTAQTGRRDFGVLSPGTWRVAGQDVKHAMICEGLGWGRLPLWAVEDDVARGRLKRLHVSALGRQGRVDLEAYLAHRSDQTLGPAARVLRSGLLSYLAGADAQRVS
ncbi:MULTISPECIES: LysR family transcriptional regulator [Stenotrophomonas]|jgi:DNA-binding transcriptional LysR family regulator|uniref:LysR family transcriptional regulator n=1 Tax=Stenotrophomonas TaxID=40323 RepID=UPI0025546699|nr:MULTISPECIES: LysR family transcriptional regulator [Stenotrophomonas]MDR2960024.1 LysR family transcriptional regulator [Stenotrophomonas sp.]MDT3501985.1 LysR family transcriptional regulator [Stenotrophomonas maltophilia]